ncbi:MAG: WD40/YVTN/BNR-like repeat-containing protein [Pseudonocardiaceae bacterium]
MNRFERVVHILDEAIGGPFVSIRAHGTFWRGLTRDQFVALAVFDRSLIVVGRGGDSDLVKALRGEFPFGSNTGTPGATFRRMPAGRPPVPADQIAFVERWIDDGCPEDPVPSEPDLAWHPTNAPIANQLRGKRYDDIWFATPDVGWGVNSDGKILRTTDGGASWDQQFHDAGTYFRCLGFASETRGWAGTLSGPARLLETRDGKTWSAVTDLPGDAPSMICGLSVVNESVLYAAGTNYPFPFFDNPPPAMMKTVDGGTSWTAFDMTAHASLLVDTYFTTSQRGWVVGGKADAAIPAGPDGRDNIKPVVLLTDDGGENWVNRTADLQDVFPPGEWGWKIQFLDQHIGFVSLENFNDGAILKTTDGGNHWTRIEINDPQQNANLEGVGFVDENRGWVGGWGTPAFEGGQSSATSDGGVSWSDASEIGKFINRFRFFGNPVTVGYAAGATVYKYSGQPVSTPMAVSSESADIRLLDDETEIGDDHDVRIHLTIPEGSSRITVNVWERFGRHVSQILDESNPEIGARTVEWDATGHSGSFIVRVTVDDNSESQIIWVGPR